MSHGRPFAAPIILCTPSPGVPSERERVGTRHAPGAARLLLVLLLASCGCNSLPLGSPDFAHTHQGSGSGTVYLFRGWRGLWSGGIDTLASKLRQKGFRAEAFRAEQWRPLARQIAAHSDANERPLILIGFSYGADDAIKLASELETQGLAVDLLITIDPVTPQQVPRGVVACWNLYESNGAWDVLPWLRGVPLHLAQASRTQLTNDNLRGNRRDLVEPGTNHSNIAANPKLHRAILRRLQDVAYLSAGPR